MKPFYILFLFFCFTGAHAQVYGCTDPIANNYNPLATINDGRCTYPSASVSPVYSVNLPEGVRETSGLILWDNLFTHNDSGDKKLYALNSITGAILQTRTITGVTNQDWEDIAQDSEYIYVGDIGNNSNGNRSNLKIIRVNKQSLLSGSPVTDNINFSYSNQTDFTPAGGNNTDFDCEALVVSSDSIYLFTKQWVSRQTSVYALPKIPGTYVAQLKSSHNVGGLITGAAYMEDKRLVVLTGYSSLLQPFFYLLYDFRDHDFFTGNKRKIKVSLSFHQLESLTTTSGLDYFATNEYFSQPPFINVSQKLHKFNLTAYLGGYIGSQILATESYLAQTGIKIYPNPVGDTLFIEGAAIANGTPFSIFNVQGKEVFRGTLQSGVNQFDISGLSDGLYSVRIEGRVNFSLKLVKK